MSRENPYLPNDFEERIKNLPEGHPARETTQLTVLQSLAFPILIWFFSRNRFLGQGRSYLAAHIILTLAMRGDVMMIDDISLIEYHENKQRINHNFMYTLVNVMEKDFREHIFEINKARMTVTYKGIKPR